jgi:protein-disulfide isomerase
MKTATFLLLSLAAFGQAKRPAAAPATPAAPTLDKVKLEAYLRHVEVWVPQIAVKIDDPIPAPDLPGFSFVAVHLTYNKDAIEQSYYVSADGQKILKGQVWDLNKSPFQGALDKIKTDNQPSFGAKAPAPVSLVVFGDFECPYCKEEASVLRTNIPASFGDKVRVYFMDYPLESLHPWARSAAVAGRCVYRQSPDAFWKYHDWIYENQQEVNIDNYSAKLMEWAGKNGMDSVQLGRCIDSKATEAEVERTKAMGQAVNVDGTPTLFLNGRKLMDQNAQWPVLSQLIALEIDHQATVAAEAEKCCVVDVPKILK